LIDDLITKVLTKPIGCSPSLADTVFFSGRTMQTERHTKKEMSRVGYSRGLGYSTEKKKKLHKSSISHTISPHKADRNNPSSNTTEQHL
jgi:hypothetical protein